MKFHNIAFGFGGIMAMIFGVMGAARADTTTTIASQAYVDAKLGTRQAASTQNYSVGNSSGGWTQLSGNEQNALGSGITSAKVTQHDSAYTATSNATDSNVIATATANTNLLKASGLQSGVLHMKGTGTTGYLSNVNNNAASDTGSVQNATVSANAKTAWDGVFSSKYGDNFVPSVASVERRIQEAVAGIGAPAASTYIADSITDGVTNKAPSQNAVYDALANKANTSDLKYNKLDNTTLRDVNTAAVPASGTCTESVPCMLTYYANGSNKFFRWTPMDTDGTSANLNVGGGDSSGS